MKKFNRLSPKQRKEEIRVAALKLFNEKGFAATTMENIVGQVSLSKGGVYRLYPSTTAILSDLMLEGMHLRNAFYVKHVQAELTAGKPLTLQFLIEMIVDSLLIYPEFSSVYVEFLWEKQRNPALQALYEQICATTMDETAILINQYGADKIFLSGKISFEILTNLMNGAILSLHILHLQEPFATHKEQISVAITQVFQNLYETI